MTAGDSSGQITGSRTPPVKHRGFAPAPPRAVRSPRYGSPGDEQIRDLEATGENAAPGVVGAGTPHDLVRSIVVYSPLVRVRYGLEEKDGTRDTVLDRQFQALNLCSLSNVDSSESMATALDRLRLWLETTQVFASSRSRRRFFVHLLALVLAVVVVTVLVQRHFAFLTDARALREFIRGYGILAPGVLVVLQAVQVVAAPVPGQVLAVVAGYLFGVWWGTLYNMIGITIGSTIAFWISRRYGRAYVETIVHDEALARFDAVSDDYGRSALFFVFLVPGLPDDVLCFAGGLTRIPLWQLVVLAVVGRTPAFFLTNVVGNLLETGRFQAAIVLTVVLVVISAVAYRYRDPLVRLFRGDS